MKSMLDKIDREERQSLKRKKQLENKEEKRSRVTANKLSGMLFKQKELLKKEIMRKREALEKHLLLEVHVSCVGSSVVFLWPHLNTSIDSGFVLWNKLIYSLCSSHL